MGTNIERVIDKIQQTNIINATTFPVIIWKYFSGLLIATNRSMFMQVKCKINDVVNIQSNARKNLLVTGPVNSDWLMKCWMMEGTITSTATQKSTTASDITNTLIFLWNWPLLITVTINIMFPNTVTATILNRNNTQIICPALFVRSSSWKSTQLVLKLTVLFSAISVCSPLDRK
jgi:hypothetical protein